MWSLIDPSVFTIRGNSLHLTFENAMKFSEMHLLGDSMLGVEPPLVITVRLDHKQERGAKHSEDTNQGRVAVAKLELRNAGRLIEDPLEKKLAWFLIRHGRWAEVKKDNMGKSGQLESVDYEYFPQTPDDDSAEIIQSQGMAIIGSLSTLGTQRFLEATTTESGAIRALRDEPEPAQLAQLVPGDYWDQPDRALRLWRFIVDPPDIT
jgi:hypothetical protein